MRVKFENSQDEVKKVNEGNNDLMILISEANRAKRDQQTIIQEYKIQKKQREAELESERMKFIA